LRARARGGTDRGNPKTKHRPSSVNIQRASAARRRTSSPPPPPPRFGAEVLKLRADVVRARCASARRTPLTRALDMMVCRAHAQVGASKILPRDVQDPAQVCLTRQSGPHKGIAHDAEICWYQIKVTMGQYVVN